MRWDDDEAPGVPPVRLGDGGEGLPTARQGAFAAKPGDEAAALEVACTARRREAPAAVEGAATWVVCSCLSCGRGWIADLGAVGRDLFQPACLWEDISPSPECAARQTLCSTDDYGTDDPDVSSPAPLGRDPERSQLLALALVPPPGPAVVGRGRQGGR